MRFSTIAGIVFIALAVIVVGGVGLLETPGATRGSDAVGLAWLFALWGSLVACMIYLISWIAESMATDQAQSRPTQLHAAAPRGHAAADQREQHQALPRAS